MPLIRRLLIWIRKHKTKKIVLYLLMADQQRKTTYNPINPGVRKPALTCFKQYVWFDYWMIKEQEWSENHIEKLTLGWRETLVISWRSTRVQVMKKMFSRQEGSGVYQIYIKMIPRMHTTYAVVASNITWIWLRNIIDNWQLDLRMKISSDNKKLHIDGLLHLWLWLTYAYYHVWHQQSWWHR